MNIQEGIKELESHKMKSEDIRTDCFNNGLNAGIAVMKKLDKPQKPVVDSFVAEWFEDNKDALDLAIFMAIRELDDEEWPHKTDFENWLDVAENKPIETLIHMKDGYEVEKEPLYYVYFPEIIASPEIFFPDIEGAYLMKSDDGIELADNNDFEDMKFTEAEIKAIDERYWAFAVPVEEVSEG
ncbi:DUF1642 domain-containing protein [Enterococcus hirae]|uniref:DUF1642 domain-containing protein n=1 Tax=Enterococcus hirae TaxID=1354 RepID=UPI0003310513|nr:DUF1642 domain-containing protein [Enterococcus hirae]EMF0045300.1 DUF1642 domain-containing protein [Enterococcus hirae]EMF0113340.1 DUF1642 domain-containing protein [Enterococcus hirae]EMF0120707.1 DUF1642 domain-containing protein [Enterococcus hirae]EMF0134098.1 DUF1642 domain-containing protein [Enterococcus hirae]EMF0476034.1 DUF1642 domain-containing protein [Enterococcus hirae]